MSDQEKAMQMLATALEMEKKGKEYYDRAARTTGNELGREVWKMLGEYELQHMDRIKEIYDSLQAGKGWTEETGPVFRFRAIWDRSSAGWPKNQKEHIRGDTGDIEALGGRN